MSPYVSCLGPNCPPPSLVAFYDNHHLCFSDNRKPEVVWWSQWQWIQNYNFIILLFIIIKIISHYSIDIMILYLERAVSLVWKLSLIKKLISTLSEYVSVVIRNTTLCIYLLSNHRWGEYQIIRPVSWIFKLFMTLCH